MKQIRLLIAAVLLLACAAFSTPATAGDGPTYLIVRGHGPKQSDFSLHELQPQPYAYGWFGAQPRYRFRSRSSGFYRSYAQWSFR